MLTGRRRFLLPIGLASFFLFFYYLSLRIRGPAPGFLSSGSPHGYPNGYPASHGEAFEPKVVDDPDYFWRRLPTRYPVESPRPLPTQRPKALPRIQATSFGRESARDRETRLGRQAAVRAAFQRCWASYKAHALPADELAPITGGARDTFGGWGATLVDSLDTLWIMGLAAEFEEAAAAAARIDFSPPPPPPGPDPRGKEINVFETAIRYLGGFLAAYDLSGDQRLLRKAREVGDMLLVAFDTPNRMPVTRWDVAAAARGEAEQVAPGWALLAEVGSLCMEFTRLSLITGDPRWFDATERISEMLEEQQEKTKLPGMWPISINPRDGKCDSDTTFGLGAMADSAFEYLPKMTALLGGLVPSYEKMYTRAMDTATRYNLFRPMTPDGADILLSGTVHIQEEQAPSTSSSSSSSSDENQRTRVARLEHQGQHLVCFAGGMFAVGGRLTRNEEHVRTAEKLTDGCVWAYRNMPLGIMPETFTMVACDEGSGAAKKATKGCKWDEFAWKMGVLAHAGGDDDDEAEILESSSSGGGGAARQQERERRADEIIAARRIPRGFASIGDARYILRPEAIESVFVLYRATGRRDLPDAAWAMFEAVANQTATALANAALGDVTVPGGRKADSMESFWLGETLKYFYLVFSEPGLVSLDEWVFNTEAHPFRRLLP